MGFNSGFKGLKQHARYNNEDQRCTVSTIDSVVKQRTCNNLQIIKNINIFMSCDNRFP